MRDKKYTRSIVKGIIQADARTFFIGIFSTILTSIIVLSFGGAIRNIVDSGVGGDGEKLLRGIWFFIGIAVLMCIFAFLRGFCMNVIAEKFCQNLRLNVYAKILHSKIGAVNSIGRDKILSILSGDFRQARTIIGTSFPFLIRSSVTLIGGLGIIFYISPFLSSVIIGIIASMMFPLFFFGKKVKKGRVVMQKAIDAYEKRIFDTVLYLKKIKADISEDLEYSYLQAKNTEIFAMEKRRLVVRSCFISMCIFIVIIAIAVAMFYGFREVNLGKMSGGDMTAFIIYAVMIAVGLGGVSEHGADFANLNKIMRAIYEISDNLMEEKDIIDGKSADCSKICVSNLEISISAGVIKIPDFIANAGDVVVFNSKSGSGKSTFFDTLLKFNDAPAGAISIGDADINGINYREIRAKITYCLQDSVILHRTLRENLECGNSASLDEIKQILVDLGLDYLITRLEDQVGDFSLSGGEKRRISLASCLLNKASQVIVLDEPTNGLDSSNISKIVSVIDTYSRNKILILASHVPIFQQLLPHRNIIVQDIS